ncbi:UNVERIFIED_CONTAM: hypothetical protein Sradi_0192600 [Sesamum radiatum]|uniref:Reverse transcriptase zinc-binding domain-containing protein n=1 Tax=Sesamum radiatum TaxID=300843 RepID=A0AAW2VZ44_SESRA
MAAHDLFQAGCRWRVGSGSNIRIWADPWLPRPRSFLPITPAPASLLHTQVSELLNLTGDDWDVEKVHGLFWPMDSEMILSIPLSRVGAPDLVIWHYSHNGIFSVRSAYHLACSLEDRPCSSSVHTSKQSWWRRVWQATIPNKVKVFVWRACTNAIPTGENLSRRIPGTKVECPLYGESKEDRLHIFLLCLFARQVWGLSHLPTSLTSLHIPDFWSWMMAAAAQLDGMDFGFFLCLCWSIWWCRNAKLMQGNSLAPPYVHYFTSTFLAAFRSQALGGTPAAADAVVSPSNWQAPPSGCIKVNFDSATFRTGTELGIGVIARDASGSCVAWLSRRFSRMGSAEAAEILAARDAVYFAVR